MSRASASRQEVAAQARKAAAAMASCADRLNRADAADTRTLAEWFRNAARQGGPTAEQNWDGAAQLYLGLAALLRAERPGRFRVSSASRKRSPCPAQRPFRKASAELSRTQCER